jgi:hypothetical protein
MSLRACLLIGAICGSTVTLLSDSFAQEGRQVPLAPLTRDELIDLFRRPMFRRNPEFVLRELIQPNKVAFLPTRATVRYLNQNGVPVAITQQLKFNFASRIVYRVCDFEPVDNGGREFARVLNTTLEQRRIRFKEMGGLLGDKVFEPVPCGPTGPTREELEFRPHTGYVLVMGDLEPNQPDPGKISITARLVFVSRVQERMSVTEPLTITIPDNRQAKLDAASRIARWSIEALEAEIR